MEAQRETPNIRSCYSCGYSLEGLRNPTCPECGRDHNTEYLASIVRHNESVSATGLAYLLAGVIWTIPFLLLSLAEGTLLFMVLGAPLYGVHYFLAYEFLSLFPKRRTPRKLWKHQSSLSVVAVAIPLLLFLLICSGPYFA